MRRRKQWYALSVVIALIVTLVKLPPDFFTFLTSSLLDDGEESLEWENTVLKDEEVRVTVLSNRILMT